jgi:hypothetical protein
MRVEGPDLAGLEADHRRQQAVAIAEPFVQAFLRAVGGARHAGCRQRLFATIDQQTQRAVQNIVLARRIIRLVWVGGKLQEIISIHSTVRYGSPLMPQRCEPVNPVGKGF